MYRHSCKPDAENLLTAFHLPVCVSPPDEIAVRKQAIFRAEWRQTDMCLLRQSSQTALKYLIPDHRDSSKPASHLKFLQIMHWIRSPVGELGHIHAMARYQLSHQVPYTQAAFRNLFPAREGRCEKALDRSEANLLHIHSWDHLRVSSLAGRGS